MPDKLDRYKNVRKNMVDYKKLKNWQMICIT